MIRQQPYASRWTDGRLVCDDETMTWYLLMMNRIGTFFGHKGAVFQARLSPDASTAATASADYTA